MTRRQIKRRIIKLDPQEISLVDKGANLRTFLVTKRADAQKAATHEVLERLRKADPVVNGKIEAFLNRERIAKAAGDDGEDTPLSAGAQAAMRAIGRIMAPYAKEITANHVVDLMGELGMSASGDEDTDADGEAADGADDDVGDDESGTDEQNADKEADDAETDEADQTQEGDGIESDVPLEIDKPNVVSDADHGKALEVATVAYNEAVKAGGDDTSAQEAAQKAYLKALDDAGYTVNKRAPTHTEDTMPRKETPTDSFTESQRAQIDAMLKKHVEGLQAENKTLVEKNAKVESDLAVEREDRLRREFTARAAAEFAELGDTDTVGAVLKAAHKDKEQVERIETILKSACKQLREAPAASGESGMFSELGSKLGGNQDSPEDELSQLASSLVQKSATKLSPAQAFKQALQSPAGQAAYRKQQKAKGF